MEPVLRWILGGAGVVLLFVTMVVTAIDVVGRYFFNAPLPGGFEVTEVLMGCFIFLAMPLVTLRRSHVTVDLLEFVSSRRALTIQALFADLVSVCVSAILTWGMWHKSGRVWGYWDYTETLHIPLAPIAYLITAMLGLMTLILAWRIIAQCLRLVLR